MISFVGRFSMRRSSQSLTVKDARLLKRSDPEHVTIKTATILRWLDTDLPLTAAPMNDPVLNAARKVVIKLAQTKMELPKNGARTREATS